MVWCSPPSWHPLSFLCPFHSLENVSTKVGKKQLALALSMGGCCREAWYMVPMARATPLVTRLGEGTGNAGVQQHLSKPHTQNPRCKSHGRPSICLAFLPLLYLSLFIASSPCVLDRLHFSLYLFPHSFPSCSPPRSMMYGHHIWTLDFWVLAGFIQWEALAGSR